MNWLLIPCKLVLILYLVMELFRLYISDRLSAIELIKQTSDVKHLSYVSPMGNTILHIAAEVGDSEVVELLFGRGMTMPENRIAKVSALQLAVRNGHVNIVRRMIDKLQLGYFWHLCDLLEEAFSCGNPSMVATLIECGAVVHSDHLFPALNHNLSISNELTRIYLQEIMKGELVRRTDSIFSYEGCEFLSGRGSVDRCVLCVAIEIGMKCRCPSALRFFLDAHNTHPSFCYDESVGYPPVRSLISDKTENGKILCAYNGNRTKVMSAYLTSLVSGRLQTSNVRYTLNIEELIDILLQYGASLTYPFPELKRLIIDAKFNFYYTIDPTAIMLALVSIGKIGEDAFLKLYHTLLWESRHSHHPRCFAKNYDFVFMGYATYGGHLKVFREVLRSGTRLFSSKKPIEEYGCKCHNKTHFVVSYDDGEWFLDSCIRIAIDSLLNMSIIYAPGSTPSVDCFNQIVDIFTSSSMPVHHKIKFGRAGVVFERRMSFLGLADVIHRGRRDLMHVSRAENILNHIKTFHHRITLRRLAYMHSK